MSGTVDIAVHVASEHQNDHTFSEGLSYQPQSTFMIFIAHCLWLGAMFSMSKAYWPTSKTFKSHQDAFRCPGPPGAPGAPCATEDLRHVSNHRGQNSARLRWWTCYHGES